jgi:protein-disulfide isomerase
MTQDYKASRLTLPVGERDHIEGPQNAPIVLVEYGDYQCPYCGAAYPIVKKVQKELGDRLRFVFRNFPITNSHPQAQWAAETAEAAAAQGKFWEMHDYLYENQASRGRGLFREVREEDQAGSDEAKARRRSARPFGPDSGGLHERHQERRQWDAHLLHQQHEV